MECKGLFLGFCPTTPGQLTRSRDWGRAISARDFAPYVTLPFSKSVQKRFFSCNRSHIGAGQAGRSSGPTVPARSDGAEGLELHHLYRAMAFEMAGNDRYRAGRFGYSP